MTTREPEFNDRDRAVILADYDEEHAPRGSHGVLISEATDPKNNPLSPAATGRFVWEPVADFAQDALNKTRDERRKAVGDEDWPLLWKVRLETVGTTE